MEAAPLTPNLSQDFAPHTHSLCLSPSLLRPFLFFAQWFHLLPLPLSPVNVASPPASRPRQLLPSTRYLLLPLNHHVTATIPLNPAVFGAIRVHTFVFSPRQDIIAPVLFFFCIPDERRPHTEADLSARLDEDEQANTQTSDQESSPINMKNMHRRMGWILGGRKVWRSKEAESRREEGEGKGYQKN